MIIYGMYSTIVIVEKVLCFGITLVSYNYRKLRMYGDGAGDHK